MSNVPRQPFLHKPWPYAVLMVLCAASFHPGLAPALPGEGAGEPRLGASGRQSAVEQWLSHPGDVPFGAAAALLVPLLLGLGLLVGYTVLRWHNVRVFPRCEFPPAPWTAWHLLRVGIVLLAVGRGLGLGVAWVLHAREAGAAWARLPTGLVLVAVANATMVLVCVFTVALVGSGHAGPLRLLGMWEAQPFRRAVLGVVGFLMVFPLVLLAAVAALILAPRVGLPVQAQEVLVQVAAVSPGMFLAALVGIVVVTPLTEELLFRGFLYATLRRHAGPLGAIALSALTFALMHGHAVGVAPLFVLGFLLAYLYERTGSLAASVAAHAAYNLYVVLLACLAPHACVC